MTKDELDARIAVLAYIYRWLYRGAALLGIGAVAEVALGMGGPPVLGGISSVAGGLGMTCILYAWWVHRGAPRS